jgi:allantoinase
VCSSFAKNAEPKPIIVFKYLSPQKNEHYTMNSLALSSTYIITPEGKKDGAVLIQNGVITGVVSRADVPSSFTIEDVGESVVMAGLVDSHVHINEPGRTEWEGFATATNAAAAGGITTLVDMPLNSSPVTTSVAALEEKKIASEGKLRVDCGFYGGIVPGNAPEILPLARAGVMGFKAFLVHSGIDDFPNATEVDLRAAMPLIAEAGLPLLVHAELIRPETERAYIGNPHSYRDYLNSRPDVWELDAIAMMIRLCREYSCRTHIVHVSSAQSLTMLAEARAEGLPLTTETCPQYLFFAAEDIPDSDTRFKCAPPIRDRQNREQIWEGLRTGILDMIVSDHSPCTPDLKLLAEGDFQKAWGGISSLQFGLPIVWTQTQKRGFSPIDIARWMSAKPVELLGLSATKGAIAAGYDADIVVWNPEATVIVDSAMIQHRHKITPYEGQTLLGAVERTYLRGALVFERGVFVGEPCGKVVKR